MTQALAKPRQRGIRFPTYSQEEAERVARVVQEKGGGTLSLGATAVGLGLSLTSSSFVGRVAGAKHFGYVEEENDFLKTTTLAKKILRPTSPEAVKQGRREAFLYFPIFKQLFERFYNDNLPERTLLENLLVLEYGVSDGSKGLAYDVFVESGKFAEQIVETSSGLFCGLNKTSTSDTREPQLPVVQQTFNLKIVELLQHVGSVRMALGLLGKNTEEVRAEIQTQTNDLLSRMLELARESNMPSIKMSIKIAIERLRKEGLEGAQHFLPYIDEGLKEDLGISGEK